MSAFASLGDGPRVTILVIDDEPQIRRAVRHALEELGATVLEAADGKTGIDLTATAHPDAIVLDLGLPDMDGVEVCREVRLFSTEPIVVLSARNAEEEKVALLNAGADDYMVKPFGLRELVARVQAHLRRRPEARDGGLAPIVHGSLNIDFAARRVTRDGHAVRLTPIEWRLLMALASQAGRPLTHRQLFDAVWRRTFGNPQQYLRVHLTNLRRKIEQDSSNPTLIVTEPGVGYRFELPASTPRPV